MRHRGVDKMAAKVGDLRRQIQSLRRGHEQPQVLPKSTLSHRNEPVAAAVGHVDRVPYRMGQKRPRPESSSSSAGHGTLHTPRTTFRSNDRRQETIYSEKDFRHHGRSNWRMTRDDQSYKHVQRCTSGPMNTFSECLTSDKPQLKKRRLDKTQPYSASQMSDKRECVHIQSLSTEEIKSLRKVTTSSALVDQLYSRLKSFQRSLQMSKKLEPLDVMDAVINILLKVSESLQCNGEGQSHTWACQILGEVLSTRCAEFQLRLAIYVKRDLVNERSTLPQHPPILLPSNCTPHAKATSVCSLFKTLLEIIPETSWSVLPVDELAMTIQGSHDLQDLVSEVAGIVSLRDEMRDRSQLSCVGETRADGDWDNSEYRKQQILPQWEDVCIRDRPPRLRPNIISGSYTDWMHYYDVQFRLLREDFIAPLRRGICEYIQGVRGRKLQNVKVYHKVSISRPLFTKEGVCYEVKFDVSRLQRCNWEHSKRLLFGSLLCLTPDNFTETVFFATVACRDPKELRVGKLHIRFEQQGARMLKHCNKKTVFTMVESLAYYEASRHILHSLQTAEIATMPFTPYLVQNQCDSVSVPKYIDQPIAPYDKPICLYDLSCLQEKKSRNSAPSESIASLSPLNRESSHSQERLCFDIMDESEWPSANQVELDESQLKAIQMALTQEIAVIQGPPGTGKTYVGLKIVESLLKNREVWDPSKESPIVVMCYTNHALDQFLEGIWKQGESTHSPRIVRVGSRSRNELMQQFNINKIRRGLIIPSEVFRHMKECEYAVSRAAESIEDYHLGDYLLAEEFCSNGGLLLPEELNSGSRIISPDHWYQLFERVESLREQHGRALQLWLAHGEDSTSELQPAPKKCKLDPFLSPRWREEGTRQCSSYQKRINLTTQEQKKEHRVKVSDWVTFDDGSMEVAPEDDVQNEEFIDVLGEATIEQEARVINDDDFQPNIAEEFELEHETGCDSSDIFTQSDLEDVSEGDDDEQQWSNKLPPHDYYRHNAPRRESCITKWSSGSCRQHPMTPDQANAVENIHKLTHDDRWRLYNYWVSEYLKYLIDLAEEDFEQYDRLCRDRLEARKQTDRFALETADVVGVTTTGAAKYQHILHLVKPKIVIVEEAAEVLESHIVSALNAGTQHLILIGDHKQLRPKPNDYTLAKKYHLDISLFERLVRNNFPHATLLIQHRMRPEIAQLVKPHIYETLVNHESVETYEAIRGVEKNLYFIQHGHPETKDENLLSHSSQHEAKYLAKLCKYLLQQGYKPSQITVLVTYAGQLLMMRDHMPKRDFEGVRVSTVDNFQGEENDIILLSLVRSNELGKIGFLKEENRVCVALSRAKMGLYCIGNIKMLRGNAPIWEAIMSDIETKGCLGDSLPLGCAMHPSMKFTAKIPEDFDKNAPQGGCSQCCDYRLS